ncbi:MAG: hypothetical protein F4103_05660 [Boseongicola sp. SB0673_bin_14]|nr:hypothetical protein [Boseongicola sp. SB0673_bin_14]
MSKNAKTRKIQPLPKPVTITLPDNTFQPRNADMEREYDMPGASMELIRQAFFRPVKVLREEHA